jgi:ElaB/YqjD/DUF883 family membrane-anchored ribosome-binding protein
METPDDVRSVGATAGGGSLDSTARATNDANVEQLKSEIAETQAELQQTVAEIQERLNPTHLKEQATDAVREATIGRVQHMMHRAGDTLGQAAETTRDAAGTVTAGVRSNPIPYALIAIGAAWLIANRRSNDRWSDSGYDDANWNSTSTEYQSSGAYASGSGYGRTGGEYVSAGQSSGAMGGGESASDEWRANARDRARQVASRARNRWDSMLHENPMALGIAALAAGALVGAAFPSTQVESRYLGEARDSLVDTAREAAQTTVQKVTGTENQQGSGASV